MPGVHKMSMAEPRQGWAAHPEQPQGQGQQPGQLATALEGTGGAGWGIVRVRIRARTRARGWLVLYRTVLPFAARSSTVTFPLGLVSVTYIIATGGQGFGHIFGHINKICLMVIHPSMEKICP